MAASSTGTISTKIPFCPPPCACADCETYYYTLEQQKFDRFHYTEVLTDAKAKALLAKYINGIDTARAYLRQSIHQHGDLILDRWRKRNPKKRAALLHIAEPELPAKKGHHADVQYAGIPWREGRSSAYRKYLLVPYLDLETLTKNPAVLIGLLHSRAKDTPADWAPYDHEQLRTPWGLGLFDVAFNEGAVITFGPRYGTYSKWKKDSAHKFDMVGYPRGRLLFEVQATLMTFLQRVVQQLLASGVEDDRSNVMGCTRWNVNIDNGLKMTGDATAWSNFVQTPFTAPPSFDVDTFVALAKARVDATGDHLTLLQTEPSYFRRYIRKLYQMQTVESAHKKHVAITVVNWEIVEDINLHWFWRGAFLEFQHLQNVYHRYRDSITTGQPLPRKVDQALGALELVLVNAIHERSQQLQAIVSQRP
jgi:hypothetical protein